MGGHGPRRFMRKLRKLGMRIRQLVLSMLWSNGLAIRNSSEIMLCFVKIHVFYAHVTKKRTRCSSVFGMGR